MQPALRAACVVWLLCQAWSLPAFAQATPTPTPTIGIPRYELAARLEANLAELAEIRRRVEMNPVAATVEGALPETSRTVETALKATMRQLAEQPALPELRELDQRWQGLEREPQQWLDELTARAATLESELSRLNQWQSDWEAALQTELPPEVIERVGSLLREIEQAQAHIRAETALILRLQAQVSQLRPQIGATRETVGNVYDQAVVGVLTPDRPAIWSPAATRGPAFEIAGKTAVAIDDQFRRLSQYLPQRAGALLVHSVVVVLLIAALASTRRKVEGWVLAEPTVETAAQAFRSPVAVALLLSVPLSGAMHLYPAAPPMLGALVGALVLIPAVVLLRRLLASEWHSVLYALVLCFFVDQVRVAVAPVPEVARGVFLLELLGALLFLGWRHSAPATAPRLYRWLRQVAFWMLALAFTASALGYAALGELVGNAVFRGAYLALVLYAVVRILDGLCLLALRSAPLNLLASVRHHRMLIRARVGRILRWILVAIWAMSVLEIAGVRRPLWGSSRRWLEQEIGFGQLRFSPADVLAFGLVVWAAFALSRLLRFFLQEDVYPRVELERGVPYALSTLAHYLVLLLGFLVGLGVLGIDMTRFAILAGALGVGVGLGLQSIVNNFVSGLILLFERPVKAGDVVQVGTHQGELRKIGLRASVLRTWQGSEVIVPNADLISNEVVNWTFSDQQRRIDINVGVAYGTDPATVIRLLEEVATQHLGVLPEPAPQALFMAFGDSSLNFRLSCWTEQYERWMKISSDLSVAVNASLAAAEIEIPFPQRVVHLVRENDSRQ